jgi:hypothetical protein
MKLSPGLLHEIDLQREGAGASTAARACVGAGELEQVRVPGFIGGGFRRQHECTRSMDRLPMCHYAMTTTPRFESLTAVASCGRAFG